MNAITDKIRAVSEKTNRNIQIVDTIIPLVEEIQRLRLIVTTRTGDVDALERSWDELYEENMILKKTIEGLEKQIERDTKRFMTEFVSRHAMHAWLNDGK
jgi:hypothetical protein